MYTLLYNRVRKEIVVQVDQVVLWVFLGYREVLGPRVKRETMELKATLVCVLFHTYMCSNT